MLSTPPALLVGLGARVAIDTITRSSPPSARDFILLGIWQGIALHYSSRFSGIPCIVASAIAAKLFIEFQLLHDADRSAITLVGLALGVLGTEFLSQLLDSQSPDSDRRAKKTQNESGHSLRKERVVHFRNNGEADARRTKLLPKEHIPKEPIHTISDITSIDSSSEMLSRSTLLSPSERLEREIKDLRTRASLADSERRRFKEERKWAISQGNQPRASQMKWQVKRYTALMQSFHREADAKLIEGFLDFLSVFLRI